ncbi:uncharacterized protein LOC143187601 [Calliopsis andreniformis]|uniref:uncharacterized protein LOC143187601 n=1 Tax=Calliopsis andreniformis TaxID=337506 RepID=UPI003FCE8D0F
MVLFTERCIRGGLSQCSGRYAQANNKYMLSYDPSKSSSYLMYFDINNLYGWAMSQPLPYAGFQWIDSVENFDVSSIAIDSSIGYILEVDIEYSQHLHDDHADLPFCPTRAKSSGKKQDKLLATLYDKERYGIHYCNLQQCIHHGLHITKIQRILEFNQSPWLRDYIELNTQFRTHSSNDFEKNLFGVQAIISKPNFQSRSILSENLVAIELRKLMVKFNKSIYVGMAILNIFHYDYMCPLHQRSCKIMYTDTDSLIYYIQCEHVYEMMKCDIHRFDTSDYPKDNVYGIPLVNKKGLVR